MPTPLYRFHCTDGRDLIADLQGRRLPTLALVRRHAEQVALALMRSRAGPDWSAWAVEVYDEKGRALLSATFADLRDGRPSAGHGGGKPVRG